MNINFELYKVFYTVANCQSISKGADKLLISQPAVTQSIQTLEAELGGKLFIRTPKGVILTPEGQELYNYITEGMNYFINGTNKFTALKNLEEGILTIGSTTTISEHYLMPYLQEFRRKYPHVDINITNDLTENLIKNLRNGSLDIIITAIPNRQVNDLEYHQLTTLTDIFVGSSKYQNKSYPNLPALLQEDLLLQKSPSVTRTNFNDFLKANHLTCTPKMEVVSHSLLTSLAEHDFGLALLTKEFILDKLNHTLFEINLDLPIPSRQLGYAIKCHHIPSFTTQKFIDILTTFHP